MTDVKNDPSLLSLEHIRPDLPLLIYDRDTATDVGVAMREDIAGSKFFQEQSFQR